MLVSEREESIYSSISSGLFQMDIFLQFLRMESQFSQSWMRVIIGLSAESGVIEHGILRRTP